MVFSFCFALGIRRTQRKNVGRLLHTNSEVSPPVVSVTGPRAINPNNNVRTAPRNPPLSSAAGLTNSSGSAYNDQLPTYDVLMMSSSTNHIVQPTAPQIYLIDEGDYQTPMTMSSHHAIRLIEDDMQQRPSTSSNAITSSNVVPDIIPFTSLAPPPTYEEAISQPNSRKNSLVQ